MIKVGARVPALVIRGGARAPYLNVEGAGESSANGKYLQVPDHNGRSRFFKYSGPASTYGHYVQWSGAQWELMQIDAAVIEFYTNPSTATEPPQTGWLPSLAAAPAPTLILNAGLNATLVTNGAFDADTNWAKGTGWLIAAGVASSDGSQPSNSNLTQAMGIQAGVTYQVGFRVTAHTSGSVRLNLGGSTQADWENAVGDYVYEVTPATSNGTLYIQADANFVGSIDDVTIKEIL